MSRKSHSSRDENIPVVMGDIRMPMQYIEVSDAMKIEQFGIFPNIFLIFAQTTDCRNRLESPQRDGSNQYPQSLFWAKNKKSRFTHVYPNFTI